MEFTMPFLSLIGGFLGKNIKVILILALVGIGFGFIKSCQTAQTYKDKLAASEASQKKLEEDLVSAQAELFILRGEFAKSRLDADKAKERIADLPRRIDETPAEASVEISAELKRIFDEVAAALNQP